MVCYGCIICVLKLCRMSSYGLKERTIVYFGQLSQILHDKLFITYANLTLFPDKEKQNFYKHNKLMCRPSPVP